MRYSAKERFVAHLLSSFPELKQKIKYVYQRLNYWRFKKDQNFHSENILMRISDVQDASFFGYYDRSPMSEDGKQVLFHSTSGDTRKEPRFTQGIDVMLFDLDTQKAHKVATTQAFNWQQGAKSQWLNQQEIIFNDYFPSENKYVSKIYNTETKQFRTIDNPIYDVFQDYALSLSFDRLSELRPDYGYFAKESSQHSFDLDKEGLIYVDLKENTSHLLLSIDTVIKNHYREEMDDADHLVNHIMISPCGTKFMFLHRWFKNGVRHDSLMICDRDGRNLKCLADDGMVSHCCWKSKTEIVAYLNDSQFGANYYLIDIVDGERKPILFLSHLGDGHPHVCGDEMLVDTYPNKARMKELLLYNFKTNQLSCLGEFFESFQYYGQSRCDLHPRFSRKGETVFVDSVHEGERHLYMMKK
jgi:hypothetical protein|tara:strand:- start:1492 stop:2733 length:1242 start_codon:yes stop_codon:yes gene_type:complete